MTSGSLVLDGQAESVDRGPQHKGRGRRLESVCDRMICSFLTLWLLAIVWVVASFAMPPRDYLRAADWQLDGGPVESYEVGVPRMIQGGPEPVWVLRRDATTFTALAAVCQYQHCVVRWNPVFERFSCPCHRGTYDLDGRVTSGPSRHSLRSFFVNVKAERVRVHLLRLVEEEP